MRAGFCRKLDIYCQSQRCRLGRRLPSFCVNNLIVAFTNSHRAIFYRAYTLLPEVQFRRHEAMSQCLKYQPIAYLIICMLLSLATATSMPKDIAKEGSHHHYSARSSHLVQYMVPGRLGQPKSHFLHLVLLMTALKNEKHLLLQTSYNVLRTYLSNKYHTKRHSVRSI